MDTQLAELFPARIRKEKPSKEDWEIIKSLIGQSLYGERDSCLYMAEKLCLRTSNILTSVDDSLHSLYDALDDIITRTCAPNTSSLTSALRSLRALAPPTITGSTKDNKNLSRFMDHSQTFLTSIRSGMGNLSASEVKTLLAEELVKLGKWDLDLLYQLEGLEEALTSYSESGVSTVLLQSAASSGKKFLEDLAKSDNKSTRDIAEKLIAIRTTLTEMVTPLYPRATLFDGMTAPYSGSPIPSTYQDGVKAIITGTKSAPYANTVSALTFKIDGVSYPLTIPTAKSADLATMDPGLGAIFQLGSSLNGTDAGWKNIILTVHVNGVADEVSIPITTDGIQDWIKRIDLINAWIAAGLPILTWLVGNTVHVVTTRFGEDATIEVQYWEIEDAFAVRSAVLPAGWQSPTQAIGYIDGLVVTGEWAQLGEIFKVIKSSSPAEPKSVSTAIASGSYGKVIANNRIQCRKMDIAAADLVVDGTATLKSTSYNFGTAGVIAGDLICLNTGAETLLVESVAGQRITVTPTPITAPGSYDFYVYPDFSIVMLDDMLDTDFGKYKITALAAVDTIQVQTLFPHAVVAGMPYATYFEVAHEAITLESPSIDTTSAVQITAAPTQLGLAGTSIGALYGWEAYEGSTTLDLSTYRLRLGDLVHVGAVYSEITELDTYVGIDTPLPIGTTTGEILNPDFTSYLTLKSAITAWKLLYEDSLKDTIRLLKSLLNTKSPKAAQIASIKINIATLRVTLQTLKTSVDAYDVREVPVVNSVLDTLKDMDLDRAYDILRDCRFSDFFDLTYDEITYAAKFADESRVAIRELGNQSRYENMALTELGYYSRTNPDSEMHGNKR